MCLLGIPFHVKLRKGALPKMKESKKNKDMESKKWAPTGDRVEEIPNILVKEGPKMAAEQQT